MAESQYDPKRHTAVGDLSSSAKGSGARDNAGKARVDLLTWLDVAYLFDLRDGPMGCLGRFQETHDPNELRDLVRVLYQGDIERAIREAAAVFEFGAKKYKAWNWLKGMPWSVPLACAGRHLLALQRGEQTDPDSKLPHAGHVVCNVFMLLAYDRSYREGNDLPPLRFNSEQLAYGARAAIKHFLQNDPAETPKRSPYIEDVCGRAAHMDDILGRDRPLETGDDTQ